MQTVKELRKNEECTRNVGGKMDAIIVEKSNTAISSILACITGTLCLVNAQMSNKAIKAHGKVVLPSVTSL